MAFKYTPSPFMLPTSHYDKKKADRAVTFIQNLCHTKGKWAGQKFLLLPWQEQIVRDIFCIVRADGKRQFLSKFRRNRVSPSWLRRLLFICYMQTVKQVLKSTVLRVTETRHPSFLMWQSRWFRCPRH